MNITLVLRRWLGLACALCGPAMAQTVAEALPQAPADLDAAVAGRLRAGGVPGAAVVVIEGGRVVMARSYGLADRAGARAVTPETVFRAGSISKTFTAVAAMQLVEQQRVALDAPMADLLPEWQLPGAADPARPLRLAHLLEHTAGLDDIRYRHYLIEGANVPLAQALTLFGPYRLRWAPGDGTAYSNAGAIAVGRVIEKASGEDFPSYMARAVTGPMGMTSARWTRDPAQAAVLASSYQADGRTPEPYAETPARPSGSLSVTAADLARLPLMLLGRGMLDGRRVLQATSVERMEQPSTSAAARRGVPLGWGPGLRADADGRALFFGHDGSIDGFVATFAYAPTLQSGYVVMANLASEAATETAQIVRRYLERRVPAPVAQVQPVTDEQRRRWAGQYQSVTPRQELLRAIVGLTQWEGASFDGDILKYERARWQHLGSGRFQKEGAAAPALLFIDTTNGMQAHTRDGAKRRVGTAEMAIKLGVLTLLPLALLAGLASLVGWAVAAARGRGTARTDTPWRLWPLAALGMALAAPLSALALLGTGDLARLGRPNAWAWAVWALSLLAPAVTLAAAVALWRGRRRAVRPTLRVLAWTQLALATAALTWLAAHSWIGLRLWDA